MTSLQIPMRNRPVYLQTDSQRLVVLVRGEPFMTYAYGPGRSPAVDVLCAADNRQVAGCNNGAPAITIGHSSVNQVSYLDGGLGSIEPHEIIVRRGIYSAGFVHHLVWRDNLRRGVIAESRRLRVIAGPCEGGILDLTIRLTPLLSTGVIFAADGHDLLQIHLASSLFSTQIGQMRDEHGRCGWEEVNGRISRWVSVDGVVRGETVGIVVLDHPRNPFHPTTWHADQLGTLSPSPIIWAGVEEILTKPVVLRYRVLTHLGYVEAGWSHARFLEYASEPSNENFGD